MIQIFETDAFKFNTYDIKNYSWSTQINSIYSKLSDNINKNYSSDKIINVIPKVEKDNGNPFLYYVSATIVMNKQQ